MLPARLEERMEDLETRSMHQERLLDRLNDVLVEHQATLDRLAVHIQELQARTRIQDEGGAE